MIEKRFEKKVFSAGNFKESGFIITGSIENGRKEIEKLRKKLEKMILTLATFRETASS
ncbi:MAG TPA: hypothetical protein VGB00_03970 [Pyrinomonadaceae bacterium]